MNVLGSTFVRKTSYMSPALQAIGVNRRPNFHFEWITYVVLMTFDLIAFVLTAASSRYVGMFLDHALQSGQRTQSYDSSTDLTITVMSELFIFIAIFFLIKGHYREKIPFWTEFGNICSASITSLLATTSLQVLMRGALSWPMLITCWIMFPIAVITLRCLAKRLLNWAGLWQIPVVLVADAVGHDNARNLLALETPPGFRITGILDISDSLDRLASIKWQLVLKQFGARRLMLSFSVDPRVEHLLIESVVRERVSFVMIPSVTELPIFGHHRTSFLSHDTILLSYRNNLSEPIFRFLKVLFDLCLTAAALIVAAPLMLVLAVLVSRDGGPVLFAHERVGERGRRFRCLKFRTMVVDGDRVLHDTLASDPVAAAEWTRTRKLTVDPRVTRIGAFLRATSLDELPQLLNVLRLEMSLVGPRPIVEQEIDRYAEDICYYYETRPGLTGLWQVSGRSDTSYEQRVSYDKWYVKNWTAWNDLAIIAKTIPVVLNRTGAR